MSGFGTEGIIKQCSNSFLKKHKEDSSKTMNTLHKHYRFVYPLANKFKLIKVVQGCHFLTLYPKSKTEIFYLCTKSTYSVETFSWKDKKKTIS